MKITQFFETKSKQGKISLDEEFKKKLETLGEFDVPDVFVNLFDQEFLTRDRAAGDPKIHDKIRSEVLDGADAIIKDIIPFLDDKDKVDFQNETKTYTKLKMLAPAFQKVIDKAKLDNPSNDDKIKELQRQNQEYINKLAAENKKWETTLTEREKQFEEQKKVMQLDWTLDKKIGEYTFADEYKEVKSTLIKTMVDKIKNENVLILDQAGAIQIHEITESGVTKQKFNGNDPVTLDKLLEEPLKPFLKKNNGDGGNTEPVKGQPRRPNNANIDPNKASLAELRKSRTRTIA
jgi:hypothetical protein